MIDKRPPNLLKQLTVNKIALIDKDATLNEISLLLNSEARNLIEYTPWSEYSYKPTAYFAIAYSDDAILLKYYIDEKFVRAANYEVNSPVYEDACVEFFICFDKVEGYYNVEFNCIGACTAGYGKEKDNRELLDKEVIKKMDFQSTISNNKNAGTIHWEIVLSIPLAVFCYHQLSALKGKQCYVNFTKCGDKLPQPHFITWSNIHSAEPNFHLPQFFRCLHFT